MSIALLGLLALSPTAVAQDLAPADYYRTRVEATDSFASRDWARAVALHRRLLASFEGDGELWHRLALAHYRSEEYDRAAAAFERALALGYGQASFQHLNLACAHTLLGDRERALTHVEAALAARLEDRGDLLRTQELTLLHDEVRWAELTGALRVSELSRDEGWRKDLDFLVAEARRLHAGPDRPAFSERFARAADELRAAIPQLSNDRVLAEMMQLVAILNDGHSALYGPGPETPLEFERRLLPFKFYVFSDGLYVVDGAGEGALHTGRRVTRFGDVPADEVLRRLSAYRGVDNAMTWAWMGPQFYVGRLAMLREAGVDAPGGSVEVTFGAADGSEETVTIECGDFELPRKLRPSPAASGDVPLYMSAIDTHYWMTPLTEHRAHYFQFNRVRDAAGESIAEFAGELREASTHATALIIDLRHNNGGNNSLVRPLVRTAIEFEMRSPEHRIFVITSRNTFSAAQNFANQLERWTDAIFVGEPSSSSPNFVGEETSLLLPYSQVHGSISTRYWQDSSPGDDRPWIAPHVPVSLAAEDYFTNRDPALEAILEILSDE